MEQPYRITSRDGAHVITFPGESAEIVCRADATYAAIFASAYARLAHVSDSLARLDLAEEEADQLTARL